MHESPDSDSPPESLEIQLLKLLDRLRAEKLIKFGRHVSTGDLLSDRWETARFYGFGEGTSCYDNVLIYGDVSVGEHTWIGPNVILDGSGTLKIGNYCSISAGVQIYTHQTVEWSHTLGRAEGIQAPTTIGSGVYIGPNAVISMGVTIGDRATVGAMTFVNRNVPEGAKIYGVPGRIQQ